MKENYPRSQVWPYVGSGLLLLGLVLAPPTQWPQAMREIYEISQAFLEEEQEPPIHEPLVIAFDPGNQPSVSPLVISVSADESPTEITTVRVAQNRVAENRVAEAIRPASVRVTRRRKDHEQGQTVSPIQSLAVVPPPSAADPKYVWQPPPDWVPRPIQPHLGTAITTQSVAIVDERPQYVPIQRPVANRVVRTERNPQWSERKIGPPTNQSAIPFKSLGNQADIGAIEEVEPILNDDAPSHSIIAETPEGPSEPISEIAESPSSHSAIADPWPTSTKLNEMLAYAYGDRVLAKWATEIRSTLDVIEGKRVSGAAEQVTAVARLRQLATVEVDRSRWPLHHRTLHNRLNIAVLRRVAVWEPLMRVANMETSSFAKYRAHKQLADVASQLESRLNSSNSSAWSDYLSLRQLQELPSPQQQAANDAAETEDLVYSVLERLRSDQLDAAQRSFLDDPLFRDLEINLRYAIAKSIHPADLMSALETYEEEPNRANANDVIALLMRWRSAPQHDIYEGSIGAITTNFRNANLRVAVSQEMINRLVPALHQYAEDVNDTILGAQVSGRNSTLTNLTVRLIPDSNNIRLALRANGNVQSSTASRKGPVTMFNQGRSTFSAGKELIVGQNGIHVTRTETRAATGNRLVGMRTALDGIPFVGWFVRNLARQQHADQKPFLRAEILRRVQRNATQKIDREVQQRLAGVEQNIGNRIVSPLRRMDLDPRAIEMRTTNDRVIMRTRLASSTQFGAHTPRPQARADSMMSFQIHQTAANNMIEQLDLQGRRMTLEELTASLSQRLGIQLEVKNEDHLDTVIQFAKDHPLEFQFENGQITMTIHLAELDNGKRKWKNFSARGYYRADIKELDVELIRDEGIQLISERFGLRDQLALRSIFTKVLAKNTRLEVLTKAIQQQPRLQSLVVTQFTVRDGWVAVALGEDARGMRLVELSTEKRR